MVGIYESPKQLIGESRMLIPAKLKRIARYDDEYVRNGACNIFIPTEPLAGKRLVKVIETRKKQNWARFLADIAKKYQHAEKITLVMYKHLDTHVSGSMYETYAPEKAKTLQHRFAFMYTLKYGSSLAEHMTEIEL